MKRKGKIHIGTSGWYYQHWIDRFYPKEIQKNELLNYYAINFNTVELNNTFYRLPAKNVFEGWQEKVPDNFIFSIKASRIITHNKKLSDADESLDIFLERVQLLNNKLGPILFQLPPSWGINIERLETFLKNLPAGFKYTIEFRNESWHVKEVFDLLSQYNIAFCIFELDFHITPVITTADFVYIRLHGPKGKYQGLYSNETLNHWADKFTEWSQNGQDIYCYFDNDQNAFAAYNALTLIDMIKNIE